MLDELREVIANRIDELYYIARYGKLTPAEEAELAKLLYGFNSMFKDLCLTLN